VHSATELLAGFARRELSPVEVLEDCAGRIASQGTNAFTTLTLDAARAQARESEGRWRDGTARALEGVPLGVKDLYDTAGVRTTYGSRIFAEHVPDVDAEAVRRVKAAGAVVVGKTTTHEFAWGLSGVNAVFGTPVNPAHPDRVPGGSSCGSAAALAAGEVALALGTDTGGSIRVPAAFCEVTGLKPTFGRVSLEGAWPLAPSLDHGGPMARTVDDLWLLYEVLSGEALDRAVDADPPAEIGELPDAREPFSTIQLAEALAVHRRAGLWPERRADYGADVGGRLALSEDVTLEAYLDATSVRERLRATIGDELVLTRVSDGPPPLLAEHETTRHQVLRHTVTQDLLGLPSCAVGGLQVTGPPGSEARVLAAARQLQ
jgi:aspartyl-tRNA(Asn)/glutamyl-tRNA(Gln) amidotransferase subunit A